MNESEPVQECGFSNQLNAFQTDAMAVSWLHWKQCRCHI